MLKQISLGRYYPGDSLLHRLDPRVKIVISLFYMILVFLVQSAIPMAVLGLLTLALVLLSRVPLRQILNSLKPILFILVFAFVINLVTVQGDTWMEIGPLKITDQGVYTALRMAARLILLIVSTTLFLTLTTTPILVADALESLLNPLRRIGFPVHEMAMMMSIALRFVPTLLEETDKIMKAQSSRGADYDTGGLIAKARGLVSVLIPLFVSAFKRAEDLAVAMEARCYRGGEGRTRLKVMRFKRSDLLFSLLMVVLTAGILVLQHFIEFGP
ncbi:MAG: energy-coupling factor transporter transmembrane component T [Clostridiaceae bacterium]|nr:energy-coupling factor transporter transmembrane component T [Clostridiaceae bacterium]